MSFWSNLFGGGGGSRKTTTTRRPARRPSSTRPPSPVPNSLPSRTCADCGATFPQSTGVCPRCGKVFGGGTTSPARPATTRPGESVTKAVQLYNEGKVEEAIAEVKRLIEANPKHAT